MYYEATVIKTVIKNSIKSLEIDPNIYGQVNFTKNESIKKEFYFVLFCFLMVGDQLDINLQKKKEKKKKGGESYSTYQR